MNTAIDKLKVMRGVAALCVAILHCREVVWVGIRQYRTEHHVAFSLDSILAYASVPFLWGPIGVPIFFVISGYCIHYKYAHNIIHNPAADFNTVEFLKRRFLRIYPVLIGALIVTLLCDLWSSSYFPNNVKLSDIGAKSFMINLFGLQGILGLPYGSNFALWTLSLEIQFYIVYPLLVIFRQRTSLRTVTIAIILINLASWYFLERQHVVIFTSYYLSWFAGAWIAEHKAKTTGNATRSLIPLLSLLFLIAGCAAFFYYQYAAFQLWSFSFALFFWTSIHLNFSRALRFFEWIGEFSYSLYIIHLPFFVLLASVMFHSVRQDSILYAVLFMILLIPFSYGFYRIFEKPFADMLSARRTMKTADPKLPS